MFKILIKVLLVFSITLLNLNIAKSQEIKATVTVNMEQLEFEARTYVSTMQFDLERYINNQRFTKIDWEGPQIPVDITIYLSGGTNNVYSGRLLVISRRLLDGPGDGQSVTIKLYDDNWHFEYNRGANLSYNPLTFDYFRSLIDFYMLMAIGFDLDTYNELDGTRIFEDAKSIVQLGASHSAEGYRTFSQPGDFTRYNLVSELTDMRYDDFRKIITAYYYYGLDQMAFDKVKAVDAIKNVINDMVVFKTDKMTGPSVMMQAFFDTKAQELASIFNGDNDERIFQQLKYLDPSNTVLYDEAKEGKLGK